MPTYKDKNSTWFVELRYTDWNSEAMRHKKRGFKTQREAKEYERSFLNKTHTDKNLTFSNLVELYLEDCKPRMKLSTYENKKYLFEKHIIPYFTNMQIETIQPKTIRVWQNKMLSQDYKPTYLKTINNQISAIFNFAIKFYGLTRNPVRDCGSMGKKNSERMNYWTINEFNSFIGAISDKEMSTVMFNILFWTGIRCGECLALTLNDFDFDNKIISINKTYARIKQQDIITEPKTPKSKRTVQMPNFIAEMVKSYSNLLYNHTKTDRIFPVTKFYLTHEIDRGTNKSGVKKIRIHDLRHSHASMLINLGYSPLLISERLGHENIETTLQIYSHLYPSKMQDAMTDLEKLYFSNDAKMPPK